VGTKLKIAFALDRHDTVGIDCVAYNVNDIVCSGAEPLFFLDYIGVGRLVPERVAEVVKGVAAGCVAAGVVLAGGETAELPGFYAEGEYDLVGFAVGVVERDRIIDGSRVAPGDVLVGLASTGLHSSGFSLVRRAVLEVARRRLDERVEEFGRSLGEELLTPTAIYPRLLLGLMERFDVRAVANITGGGFYDNIPRVLPDGLGVRVRRGAWAEPPVFDFVQQAGNVEDVEMFRTFNMGIGLAVVVPADQADAFCRAVAGWEDPLAGPAGATPPAVDAATPDGTAPPAVDAAPPDGTAPPAVDAAPPDSTAPPAVDPALEPLVAMASPPRRAWTIGEVVPVERLGAAAPVPSRRVVITDKRGR
jgi:phosphoribosylformylglycinamidine cyclo-ligase